MPDVVHARELDNVACPFCGLLCDDLRVSIANDKATVIASGCTRSRTMFAANAGVAATALVEGKPVDLATAITRAAQILKGARCPLMMSAGTDVAGMRVLIELAERCGGSIDHANGDALFRNLRVMQDTGWISTTLTEVRNRADVLVIAGGEIIRRFPRFFERCFGDFETLFKVETREIWFLGNAPEDLPAALRERTRSIAVEPTRLAELFSVLRALHAGRVLTENNFAGVPADGLRTLLDRMRTANYGVLAWTAADLDFPHADLAVQSMCEFVKALNTQNRFSVLPLGGSDGDLTAQHVTTWQTGFPLRVDFASGAPAEASPDQNEADALLFVSALDAQRTPSIAGVPSIVLGRAGMRAKDCSVFIPVAVPGLHHAGHLYRADNVVAIPLRKLAGSALPSAAQTLQRILDRIREAP
jgi:formylmethanofuran dehydrogenase subunit B